MLILDGPNAGRKGIIAHPCYPNDGNKSSRAFLSAGVTRKNIPSQHLVVEIDDGAGRCDVVLTRPSIFCQSRASDVSGARQPSQEDPDVGALRTLGHYLSEGNGGIGQDMI